MTTSTSLIAAVSLRKRRRTSPRQTVLLAFAALALSAGGVLASPPPKILGLGPDLITILTKPPVQDRKTGVFEHVELQGEVVSETAAADNGWRSMRAVLDVSCPERRDRVRSMIVFKDHNGMGEARTLTPPTDWITPDQNTTYGLAVVKYFCGAGGARSATRLPASKSSPAEPPPAEAPLAATPPSPSPSAYAHATASVAPAPAPSAPEPSDTTTNTMGPVDTTASSLEQKPVRTPPKANVRPARPSALGPFAVQVGSTTVQADATAILDHLKATHAELFDGFQTRIEVADVGGQRHYRAVVIGFSGAADAATFCTRLHASNGCIVRRAP